MSTASMRGRGRPRYKRRKPIPALIVLILLFGTSLFVWSKVFNTTRDLEAATACNLPGPAATAPPANGAPPAVGRQAKGAPSVNAAPPAAASGNDAPPQKVGQPMARASLDRVDPVPASLTKVRVLNGNGQRGQASLVSEELTQLGFQNAADPANDEVYPNADLKCNGQIRFGPNGAGAARTLSLIVPCAQLIRDQRQNDTVDLSLGKKFDGVKPTSDGKAALKQLDDWAQQQPAQHGGQQAQGSGPTVDNTLLAKARDVECP